MLNAVLHSSTGGPNVTAPRLPLYPSIPEVEISEDQLRITRVCAHPSAWTFTIRPIKALLERYVGDGKGWVDPFAGRNSPAEFTNDHDPDAVARWHMDAEMFCVELSAGRLSVTTKADPSTGAWWGEERRFPQPPYRGVLFDPPYSYRQITEHYKRLGMKASQLDTSANFYHRVMNAICDAVAPGGLAISFGWNSAGFGKRRGFELIEIMLVNHGMNHANDTIVTVERKVQP